MTERATRIDVDAAWRRFEQRAQGVEPAAVWLERPVPTEAAALETVKQERAGHVERMAASTQPEAERPFTKNKLRYRPWLAAALAAGLTVGLFTTSWGDKALAAMLQTFRVRHLTGVAIGQEDWDKVTQALQQGGVSAQELSLDKFGTVSAKGGGEPSRMTLAEASKAIGVPVKLLPGQQAEQVKDVLVVPQTEFTLLLHVDEVNRMLNRLGAKTTFPAAVDGQPIAGILPQSVQVSDYGGGANRAGTRSLLQMKQPQLDVPGNIDVEQVRKAVLDLPFLPADARRKLEGAADWRQTLFVPVNGKSGETRIGGREVIYTGSGQWRAAIWLDGEWLYHLNGAYESDDALLHDVKEIIGS
ncbi:hypothetical protein SD70_11510 [Gordoniibacillus kamchatkensis]|uniref:Uncharacterized protein n=1 Tax=Gordoniibacillus kamchatkensis TaxID=1590651 RepID=A0ABR5AK33_9BACL|nr:hypothetical protein [Paenibacillus sp. VKM B-2647]KIL40707.1 hypothetical protein SD70_11510 [Paenibacillus sp. VKM B-2647]